MLDTIIGEPLRMSPEECYALPAHWHGGNNPKGDFDGRARPSNPKMSHGPDTSPVGLAGLTSTCLRVPTPFPVWPLFV